MKITRFINGKKLESGIPKGMKIESEVISDTILRVNNRVQRKSFKNQG